MISFRHASLWCVLFLLVFLASCSKGQEKPIVGVLLPATGVGAGDGSRAKLALEVFRTELGERSPCEFVLLNNESLRSSSVKAMAEFAEMGASVVVGPAYSATSMAAAAAALELRLPMITPSATHRDVTANNSFAFRACFLNEQQSAAMVRFALEELKEESAVILCDLSNHYSFELAESFESEFTRRGGVLVDRLYFRSGQADFSEIIERVSQSNAKVIYLPGYAFDILPLLAKAYPRWEGRVILGSDGWDTPFLHDAKQIDASCVAYLCNHYDPLEDSEIIDFVERVNLKHRGSEVGQLTALTYDALRLAVAAVTASSDPTNPVLVRDALASLRQVRGVTGMFDMNESGDPAKSVVIQKVDFSGERPKLIFYSRE